MGDVRDLPAVEGLSGELELLARVLQDGTREWRAELGEVSPEAVRYQENGNGRSIGVLLLHLADSEDWWIREVAAGRPPSEENRKRFLSQETDQYGERWPPAPNLSLQEYYDILDEVRAQTLTILRELASPDHIGRRPGTDWTYTLRWIIVHLAQHEPYHAGQMVVLNQAHRKRGLAGK
jgi:uncharacterized damage-inducible protein DinB